MRFTIRSNDKHPDWPTEPSPADLRAALALTKDRKAARTKALEATRARVASRVRVGCQSDNLDWLAMVAHLRGSIEGCWIDGSCPAVPVQGLTIEVSIREGAVWDPPWTKAGPYQYRYVTFQTGEADDGTP